MSWSYSLAARPRGVPLDADDYRTSLVAQTHVEDEKLFVRSRMPTEGPIGAIESDHLPEGHGGDVLLQDLQRGRVAGRPGSRVNSSW